MTRDALRDVTERNPSHPGACLLRPHVDTESGPTRSDMEDDFPGFCRRSGLPIPLSNVIVNGVEADAYFPQHNLIVELDGWEFHNSRASFESDRVRDADALANGTPTVRITRERFRQDPEAEADRLRRILSRVSERPGRSEPDARP